MYIKSIEAQRPPDDAAPSKEPAQFYFSEIPLNLNCMRLQSFYPTSGLSICCRNGNRDSLRIVRKSFPVVCAATESKEQIKGRVICGSLCCPGSSCGPDNPGIISNPHYKLF
ncbi:hypothetical protein TNCV_2422901 [Trichonephila clavipes]|nr:hypothetical protein TNCV_2422901 [Trichonephila clavipes]